jgi:hypothetical protein
MLATKGVRNETPPANVQFLHPINEDTDHTEYEFVDGELPPVPSNWTGDTPPPEVYTMAKPIVPPLGVLFSDDAENDSEAQPTQLDVQNDAQASTPETEGRPPAQLFPTIVSLPTPEPLPKPKPQWWSEAWDMLEGIQSEDQRIGILTPVCGDEFRLKCESDIHAIDVYCSQPVFDPVTSESRSATEEDDEFQVAAGVMWSDEVITMSAVYGKGRDPNDMHVHHLKKIVDLCPAGRGLTLHTSSEFLRTEGEKFRGLVANNNNIFTWSGPSGVLGCTGQRTVGPAAGWCWSNTHSK